MRGIARGRPDPARVHAACPTVRWRTDFVARRAYGVTTLRRRALENTMGLGTVLLIVLILLLIGAFPTWPHSRSWGYLPSGGLGLVVLIIIVLVLLGRL